MTRSKKFSFFAVLVPLCLSLFFTACEGFFTDNNLDVKIKDAIDYAHMPYSKFTISADPSAGTIIPSGQIQYKPTDYQNIEFTVKPDYEFIKWNFSYKQTSQTQDSPIMTVADPNFWKDYVKITKELESEPNAKGEISYTLQFQFIKAMDDLLVEPLCAIKPKLERYPENKSKGQSREEELNFIFNTTIDKTSIFFSQAEINAIEGITQVLKNTSNDIYAYVKDETTYFKNIQVLMGSYDLNVNSSYSNITLKEDGKTLVLFTNVTNPVSFETPTAEIRVVFKEGVKNTDGASMKETSIPVTLNKETNRKSWIGVVTDKNAAVVNYNGYNTMEEQRVTFTETPAIQFLYWKVTSSASFPDSKNKVTIKVDADEPKKLVFWGNDDISTAEEVQIIAVYEERPTYEWPFSNNTVYPKDSDIKIKFDHEINLDSFKNGYRVAIDGSSIISKFDEPVLSQDKKTVIIKADKHNRLNISGNQTVSVTIPGTVYYTVTEDNGKEYKIYLGQDVSKEYTINDTTAEKAYIKFTVPSEYGEVVRYDVSGIKKANIGDEITLTYKEKAGYQFVGWNIEGDDDNVIQAVKSDTDAMTYTFNITNKAGLETDPVTITALTKERLQVVKVSPVTNGSDSVPKDKGVDIYFNHEPTPELCKQKIAVKCNGANVKDCFPAENWVINPETLDGKTVYRLTIPADRNNRVVVSGTAVMQISFDANFFYSDAGTSVYFGGEGWSHEYKVNEETTDKTILTFGTDSAQGSLRNALNAEGYSIGRKLNIAFIPTDAYEFLYWETNNTTGKVSFDDKFQKNTNITINDIGEVTIYAKCAPKLAVTSIKVNNADIVSTNTYAKDSDITIEFNKAPPSGINLKNYLSISCGSTDVYSKYTPSLSGTILTLTAKPNERIQLTSTQVLTIELASDLYYENSDELLTSRISMNGSYEASFNIGPETRQKANVSVNNISDSTIGTIKDGTGNAFNHFGERELSKDESFILDFAPGADYEFISWNVEDPDGNLSVTDVTNKRITVTVVDAKDNASTITPVYAAKLAVESVCVNGIDIDTTTPPYPKDSSLSFTFNDAPSPDINLRNYITVRCGSTDVSSKYEYSLSDDTLTITADPNNRLQISSNQVLTVSIDKNFYYTHSSGKNISFNSSYNKSITIDTTTNNKATVNVTNGISDAGSITSSVSGFAVGTASQYSKDQTFTLNYALNSAYEFIEWEISGTSANVQLSSTTSPTTTVTIVDSASGTATINAVVAEKLKVNSVTVNGNEYSATDTYPKDSVIVLTFNKPIPTDILLSKYISLTCNNISGVYDKYNVAVSDSKITFTPNSRLDIPSTKPLVLTIDQSLYYKYSTTKNITLAETYSKAIQLTTETVQKASVKVTNGDSNAGSITSSVSGFTVGTAKDYSKDQTFTLTYSPNSAYEFIKWEISGTSTNVKLSNEKNASTTVTIENSATGTATINAVVAPKLALESMTVNGNTFDDNNTTASYPKDSKIVLNFNKQIPSDLTLSDYITLSCGNITGVIDYYTVASSAYSITLEPKSRLGITSNQTLILTIKSGLYYKYDDTRNVSLGSNVTKSITLTPETVQKAKVNVINGDSNGGSITSTISGFAVGTAKDYSKDQTFTLTYTPNTAYEFINWTVSGTTSNVQLSSTTSVTTTVTIKNSASGTATIKANVAEKLKVSSFKIKNNSGTITPASGVVYPKDSDIVIEFNQAPSDSNNVKNNISIVCNGQDVSGYFTSSLSGKVITYTASSNRIPVTATSTVYVTIKDGIYYTSGNKSVYMASQQQFTYQIDKTTRQTASITVSCDSNYGSIQNKDGTAYPLGNASYSKDEVLNLKFVPNEGYKFVYWKVTAQSSTCVNNISIQNDESSETSITVVAGNSGTVTIEPFVAEYVKVTSLTINDNELYPITIYPKDSIIQITFNKTISDPDILNKVRLYFKKKDPLKIVSAADETNYFKVEHSTDSGVSKITFTPVTEKFLDVSESELVFISIDKDIYYTVSDGGHTQQIHMTSAYNEYYQVSYKSRKTFRLYPMMKIDGQSSAVINGDEVKSLIQINPQRDDNCYYFGEKITVSFPWNDQAYYYQNAVSDSTNGWELVRGRPSSPETTTGNANNLNYVHGTFVSTSDENNFYRATIRVNACMSSGTSNGYPQPAYIAFNVKTRPQLKSIDPVSTKEIKTYPCDTPIILNFTDPVDKSTVKFGKLTYLGNGKMKNSIWICIPDTETSGNKMDLWDGFTDISEYYDLDLNEGGDNSIIIRPKLTILDLFPTISKQEVKIYVMVTRDTGGDGSDFIKSTKGNNMFEYYIPSLDSNLKSRIETLDTVDMVDCKTSFGITDGASFWREYCCIPMTIDSNISNPRITVDEDSSKFYPDGGKLRSNIPPHFNDLVLDKDAFPNANVGTTQLWLSYGIRNGIIGNFSKKDFVFVVKCEVDITKVYDYNKNTGKTDLYQVLGMYGDSETKRVVIEQNLNSLGSDVFQNVLCKIDLEQLGYNHDDPTKYAFFRIDVSVSHEAFVYPYKTTYYVLYGAE